MPSPPNPPSFLVPWLEEYPAQAGPLLTAVYDLTLSVGWIDTRITSLGGWVVLVGHKRKEDPLRAVLPLPIHTTSLRPSSLRAIFNALSAMSLADDLPEPFKPLAPTIDELRETLKPKLGESISTSAVDGDKADNHTHQEEEREAEEQQQRSHSQSQVRSSSTPDLDRETIYTAIVTPDSTVVYYKLSKGIKKPADIPDE
ncbi:hypothetical protein I317_00363 [Kwoniella heveanensis CBS 569]|uniref:tRNA-splicing endonuclease subunit Sen15 domain-containing protein n=1 Tax=Kwoniella heveanensis BCC8398 TaxID=1296120 RepID=A0A1B9GN99_9TREE|nr:hypothetical protein I316_05774 [Kwoniella heveanensis BCC8398]OCF45875.1 hypothetical protein I317_00363 [Kwoniella heveanensis CBS 569]